MTAQSDLRSVSLVDQSDPTPFEVFRAWIDSQTQQHRTFWKCFGLGLATRPNNVKFNCQARPNCFWQRRQRSWPQFLTRNTAVERPPDIIIKHGAARQVDPGAGPVRVYQKTSWCNDPGKTRYFFFSNVGFETH